MKVEYLFSKSPAWGSRLISWASKYEKLKNIDPKAIPSHVAVLLDDTIVIESVMSKGVRLMPYTKWKEKNTELYKIQWATIDRSGEEIFGHLSAVWGKPYEWRGIL